MREAKPITLHLPGLLIEQLEQCLEDHPPAWSFKKEYFYYLVHHLIEKELQAKKREFYPIDLEKLKRKIHSNIRSYLKYLVDREFILSDGKYSPGHKSYYYKLNPDMRQGIRLVHIGTDTFLFKKLKQARILERKHVCDLPDYVKLMRDQFMRVDLDYAGAKKWIEDMVDEFKQDSYYISLEMIEDKNRRYFNRNKTNGRLDTNLTSLKRELRQYIIGDWVSIDLANSQPFLLSQVFVELFKEINQLFTNSTPSITLSTYNTIPLCCNIFGQDISKFIGKQQIKDVLKIPQKEPDALIGELMRFQKSCSRGMFYEDFISCFGESDLSRDEVKEMMFAVLFSRNEIHQGYMRSVPYKNEKEQFAKVYRLLYKAIETLKQRDHAQLSILLQKIESSVFIDTICPRLVKHGVVPLTIHDSIIVKVEQETRALEICQGVFKEGFSVIPTFHVEPLNKIDNDEAGSNSRSETSLPTTVAREESGKGYRISA